VKLTTVILPMMLPKLSDPAAAQLLQILQQLIASVEHHYHPQIHRWQRRRYANQHTPTLSTPPPSDLPF
jgi:hypothetical protein